MLRFIRSLRSVFSVSAAFIALIYAAGLAQADEKKPASVPPAAAAKSPVADKGAFSGEWQIISIKGKAARVGNRGIMPEVRFSETGISGQSGCNGFGGTLQTKGAKVKFGAMAATMMACPEALMKQEHALYQALAEAEKYQSAMRPALHKAGKKQQAARQLTFLNAKGRSVLVLARK